MGFVKCASIPLIATLAFTLVDCSSLEMCLKRDSISCLQMQIYKAAKSFLDKPKLDFVGGLSVSKVHSRSGKTLDEIETEGRVAAAGGVEERQVALEDYFFGQVKHLWNEGRVSWNPMQAARSLIDSIPDDVRADITNWQGEARGKNKKQMQMLLPLLIGIKLKLAALSALAYMGIAIIAKKAVLAGVVSLVVSGFIAIKNLIESHRKHEEMTAYHAAWEPPMTAWQPGAGQGAVYDHEVAASQVKQQVAYAPAAAAH